MADSVWIVAAKRTPIGRFQGALSAFTAPELGSFAINAALKASGLSRHDVQEVYMGCVLSAGTGQAPARQAALRACLSQSTPCTTINKVCGSGMKAFMLAFDAIKLGYVDCAVAGGMESMSNAPYLLPKVRSGLRLGHHHTLDHMFCDGLEDAYEGRLMGCYAQDMANKLSYSREAMDEWAIQSLTRSQQAQDLQQFSDEIVGVKLQGHEMVMNDEHPTTISAEKISKLKPAFIADPTSNDGSVTAANSSAISDGAAATILMSEESARNHGIEPLAIVHSHTTHARAPEEFTVAPVYAIEQLLSQLNWAAEDVDLWEINEAFAVVAQIAVDQLNLDPNRVNIKGGACALGHPIGATGARIIVTLTHSLRQMQQLQKTETKTSLKGIAALCIGGGEATAVAIEIPAI